MPIYTAKFYDNYDSVHFEQIEAESINVAHEAARLSHCEIKKLKCVFRKFKLGGDYAEFINFSKSVSFFNPRATIEQLELMLKHRAAGTSPGNPKWYQISIPRRGYEFSRAELKFKPGASPVPLSDIARACQIEDDEENE